MAEQDETIGAGLIKDQKTKQKRAKSPKTVTEKIESALLSIQEEEKARILKPGDSRLQGAPENAKGLSKPRGLAAYIRTEFADLPQIAGEVANGTRQATREQIVMLRDMLDRGWGRAPEAVLVGAMSDEQRDAVVDLSKEQLLALLDTTQEPSATSSATQPIEDAVIVESTE